MDQARCSGICLRTARRPRDYAITVGLRVLTLRHRRWRETDGLLRANPAEREVAGLHANSIAHC